MNKNIPIFIGIVILAINAAAYSIADFPGWQTLTAKANDVLVVKCTDTGSDHVTDKNGIEIDLRGLFSSDIEVVSALKGGDGSKIGAVQSEEPLFQNQYYLIFSRDHYNAYQAFESYRIVPLGLYFSTNNLASKTLDQQVRFLLQWRLDRLNRQIKEDEEEKARLEEALRK
jgi:hypothetical protein